MSDALAVITGASGGVGSACVAEFAASGYRTIGIDKAPSSTANEHITIDLASPSCGEQVASAIGDREVAVLVNNAAVGESPVLVETSVETWDLVMAVNLRAPWLVARALHPNLVKDGSGSIVNVASVHAAATGVAAGPYAASKGGLVSLTRSMALEWAPGIRVNAVLPGAIDTPMVRHGLERAGQSFEDFEARQPLERIAFPDEIARVIRFVADEASFMTGSSVVVDGGVLSRLSSE